MGAEGAKLYANLSGKRTKITFFIKAIFMLVVSGSAFCRAAFLFASSVNIKKVLLKIFGGKFNARLDYKRQW